MVPIWTMGSKVHVCLLIISIQVLLVAADTNHLDVTALLSLKDSWENTPPNWVGLDPCGDGWEGIRCNNSRVTAITLASVELSGPLPEDIGSLPELQILDLSYNKGLTGPLPQSIGYLKKLSNLILVGCSFIGTIPDTIGSLQQLKILSLNSNGLSGEIPSAIGKLSKLYWLDLSDNDLVGTIPISNRIWPGLDMLVNTKHFYFGKNQLSGEIPTELFASNMTLIHVFFENNYLSGSIPSTVGLLQNLEVLRLDRNKLTGPVPSNLNDLVHVSELFLSSNQLTGPLPNLTGMNVLSYVDISNNAFEVSDFPPWFSTLQSLTTLMMENTNLQGLIPVALFSLPLLQTIVLRHNQLNGTLDLGSSNSDQLQLIDLRDNYIVGFADETRFHVDGAGFNISLLLAENPVCEETEGTETYCSNQQSKLSYSTPTKNCTPATCSSDKISSPYCVCAYPYTGTLVFKAPPFSDPGNSDIYTSLETSLMHYFESHQFPVESVSLSRATDNGDDYFELSLKIFPHGHDRFNRTEISGIGFALSNQTFKPPKTFGPFFFNGDPYGYVPGSSKGHSQLRFKVVIGVSVSVSTIIILIITIYCLEKNGTLSVNATAFWKNEGSEDQNMEAFIRQYEFLAPKQYKYSDVNKMTNAFKEKLSEGGYGTVYKGKLSDGRLVAVKILSETKGNGEEFINEVASISRTSHINVVTLLGFCFERNRRALVYEFVANGSLDNFIYNGESLEWKTLHQIAVGIAQGLEYLHKGCSTRIVHFDIKPHNILLDEDFCPKISDFGLAKLCQRKQSIISTLGARGTVGYIAPEVCSRAFGGVSHKSDVYSYGMLVLEIIGARENPRVIQTSEVYFPQWIYEHLEHGKDLRLVKIATREEEETARKMILVGLRCIQTFPSDRPSMSKVLEMLEGSLESLQIPPKPSFFSPSRLQTYAPDSSSSTMDLEVEMSTSNPSSFQIPSKPLQFSPASSGQSISSKTLA